ncbi:nucleoporin Gle1 [Aricia agestis]|uniref:nucleoporin Gle1 n=1 Tax=Aricia agestis TaxID=91739 RepID=UPI001C204DA6|nr:nucleoporin Gle1 [Aricia agestis]
MAQRCNGFEDVSRYGDINVSEQLADFEKLRVSALKNAAEISHLVTEVTIGPNRSEKPKKENMAPVDSTKISDLIVDKFGEDLRYTLRLKKCEAQLQENSEDLFKNLVEKVITAYTDSTHRYWKKQSDKWKGKSLELRAKKLQMVKQLQENDNLNILEKTKLDEKKCQIINSQTIENMNRILDEQNKATARFAAITDSYTKVCFCYNEILSLAQNDTVAKQVFEKYLQEINNVIANIKSIMDFCENATISEQEVSQAEVEYKNINKIKHSILRDIEAVQQQEQILRQKKEDEMKKQIEEQRIKEENAAHSAKLQMEESKKMHQTFYSEKNYAYYIELDSFLNNYELKYKNLLENTSLKKFRFDCQKAVNTPVNALSSVSGTHIRDKYTKLAKLLNGERVQVLDTYVNASENPQGVFYCTALLAKKIVRQGELLVSSNPEAAFPLAALTVALWSQFPEFGKLLEAYFHRYCPYLVPMLLPQKEGQSDKDFYISRGYTYNDEGVVEKQDKFLRRMSGIFRLRSAIWIAKTPRFLNAANPNGLRYGWQWLASFINLKAEPDICATLILDFFTVCGSEFYKTYGKQCVKMIKVISTEYMAILGKIDEGGPKTRLELFLQNVLKTGHIEPPKGQLPQNTW